jgi:hypothetical protein
MSEPTTLAHKQDAAVSLIREAMANKADPAYLRELLAVRREWEADEARKAFNFSISDFQRRAPIIAKADKAYDKEYARMDRIWREIRPLLTELGLSVTWQVCEMKEGGICHVEGQLRHKDGHGERLCMDVPVPELIKGQNKAQQMGSASTYAKRYAMTGALGIVTGDDDDGHKAGTRFVTHDQAMELRDLISVCKGINGYDDAKFWAWVGAKSETEIESARYNDVVAFLKRKIAGTAKP